MWEWSHTDEAYATVSMNIANQAKEWLCEVWAEWKTAQAHPAENNWQEPEFLDETYTAALAEAQALSVDTLAQAIYDWASEQADCTNGGWQAYCCPYHCGAHEISFS